MVQKDKQEHFDTKYNASLEHFFDITEDSLSQEEQAHLYPLQKKIKATSNRYTTSKLIGQGSKKFIFKVADSKTGRPVAKAILKDATNPDNIEQFIREARLTSLLQHPNIIPIYDIGFEEEDPFFTMELMRGNTLATIIKELYIGNPEYLEKYPRTTLLDILIRVCDAMTYAHSVQVIHLDLKPENIHVGEFGEVHICDWGLAKILTEDDEPELDIIADPNELNHMTLNGQIKGTPGYMAPEQCIADGEKTKQTDIYALGALLYSLITYTTTISRSKNVDEMLAATINGEITPPRQRKSHLGISPRLESITMKALCCEPEKRYQTMHELRSDLSNCLRGFATMAENAGFITHVTLLVKRHVITSTLIIAFALIVSGQTISFINQLAEKEDKAVAAQQEAENALKRLKKEVTENKKLSSEVISVILGSTKKGITSTILSKEDVINRALATDIDKQLKKFMIQHKGIAHFVNQEFNKATKYLEGTKDNKGIKRINDICKKYGKLKDDSELLTDEQLAEIMIILKNVKNRYSFKLYGYHINRLREEKTYIDPQKHFQLAIAMLSLANKHWQTSIDSSNLKKTPTGYSLDLSGSEFRLFHSAIKTRANFLGSLQLTSLDLSDSAFFSFDQLYDLKGLKTLNIAGCRISRFTNWQAQRLKKIGLKRVIVNKEQFPANRIKAIRKHLEVIEIGG